MHSAVCKLLKVKRLPASGDESACLIRFRFLGMELQDDARVVIRLHRSPRLSSNSSSEAAPFHCPPHVARARPAKSGNLTASDSNEGRSRATTFYLRVICTSRPASTSGSTLDRLCWVSMIENCFIAHTF